MEKHHRILIVDDDPAARYAIRRALESSYDVVEAGGAAAARAQIEKQRPDMVILDLVMPEESGIDFLRWMRAQGQPQPVLVASALDSAQTAVEALRHGAGDYVVKGYEVEELRNRVRNLLKLADLDSENARLRRELVAEGQFGRMLGRSPAMQRLFEMVERAAPTGATILILGESGTGKDLLAHEIHARSPRAGAAFVALNCAALPEALIEAELFGFEKGAFTGATQQRRGKFEMAGGGTLFLDEIGDMNAVTQAKVLRAIENRQIERLGGSPSIDVDVRIISATHRDLPAESAAGRFRDDLYYRLRVVTMEVPPLREHKEDVALLAGAFLDQLGARHGRRAKLSPSALAALERYDWPGNVRELKNALERSMILARGEELQPEDLPEEVRAAKPVAARKQPADAATTTAPDKTEGFLAESDFREAKRQFEIVYLKQKLEQNHWNVSRTAAAVGLHRQSLQEKLRELRVTRPGK
jgi:DNA-binding NtrC family response regulator